MQTYLNKATNFFIQTSNSKMYTETKSLKQLIVYVALPGKYISTLAIYLLGT